MSRQADLEQNIAAALEIIRAYEAILRTSDRPEEKQRARRLIEEQKALVVECQVELRALGQDVEALAAIPCPYRGLEAFEREHAPYYYGREDAIREVVTRIETCDLVAVVGPSGCGKSSLVRAGVAAVLGEAYTLRVFRPGAAPLRALAAELAALLEPDADRVQRAVQVGTLAQHLRTGGAPAADAAAALRELHPDLSRLVLVADQFEELYTECRDEALRAHFLAVLLALAGEGIKAVLTLRADFYGHVLSDRALGAALMPGLVNLLPMSEDGLRAAIELPALQAGRRFEPGLVDRILEDLRGEPGSLPLLEFALTGLWEVQAPAGVLTHSGYEEIGEVAGAIARRAEAVYARLEREGHGQAVQRVFLRLAHYGQEGEGTRRRAAIADLVTPRVPRDEVERVVKALADARLVVTGREDAPEVEVAHEALIRGWERLGRWLKADYAFGLWREKLAAARGAWVEAGRDEGALLRGALLAEAEGWLGERGADLNAAEREFVEAGLALRAGEQRRRVRLRNVLIGASLVVALVMSVLGLYSADRAREAERRGTAEAEARETVALQVTVVAEKEATATYALGQSDLRGTAQAVALRTVIVQATVVAEKEATATSALGSVGQQSTVVAQERDRAEWQQAIAESRALAAYAEGVLDQDPQLALLLSIEAVRRTYGTRSDPVTMQAIGAIHKALERSRERVMLDVGGAQPIACASWDPAGERILTAGRDGVARVWDARTGAELLALVGHRGPLYHAAWDGAGERIATASQDRAARVWDARTGAVRLLLAGHTAGLYDVLWDRVGQQILTVSADDTARVWDARTGGVLLTLVGHSGQDAHAAWDSAGQRILSLGGDGTAWVRDARTGAVLLTLGQGTQGVYYAIWDGTGERIVTASGDSVARVWDARTGAELLALAGHTGPVYYAAWDSAGERIVTGGQDGTARVWDVRTGAGLWVLAEHAAGVTYAAWDTAGERIVTVGGGRMARVWDARTGAELLTLGRHAGEVLDAAWDPAGERLVIAGGDGTACVWDVGAGTRTLTLAGHTGFVYHAAWDPAGERIVTSSWDDTARVWDARTGAALLTLSGHTSRVRYAVWVGGGERIVTASADGTVWVWDARTGANLRVLGERALVLTDAAWDAVGKRIVTAGDEDWTATVWDTQSGTALATLDGHTDEINHAAWDPAGERIVTTSYDGTAVVWDAGTAAELVTLAGHTGEVVDAAWDTAGERIVTASWDGTAVVWDAGTGAALLTLAGHGDDINHAVWDPAGERIATTSEDGTATVWDARTGVDLLTLAGHAFPISYLSWDAARERILTGSEEDGTARVWDAQTGAELLVFGGHTDPVRYAAWDGAGERIVTANQDGTAHIYWVDIDLLLDLACGRAARNMTPAEWGGYVGAAAPYRATCPELPVRQW